MSLWTSYARAAPRAVLLISVATVTLCSWSGVGHSETEACHATPDPVFWFEYHAAPSVLDPECPSADILKTRVSDILGRNPFVGEVDVPDTLAGPARPHAQRDTQREAGESSLGRLGSKKRPRACTIAVVVAKHGDTAEASVQLTGIDGAIRGERVLRSRDCHELIEGAAIAIAVAIDPLTPQVHVETEAHPPKNVRLNATVTADLGADTNTNGGVEVDQATLHRAQARGAVGVEASLETHVSFASTPGRVLGIMAGGRLVLGAFTVGLEGRFDRTHELMIELDDGDGASASTRIYAAVITPCYRFRWMSGCAVLAGGSIRSTGAGLVHARQTTSRWAALGARAALSVPIAPHLDIEARAELLGVLTRTRLRVGEQLIWTSPKFAGVVGLGPTVKF